MPALRGTSREDSLASERLEQLARAMLAKDPALKAAFAKKLHGDPAFAAASRARLAFFFERSRGNAVQHVGAYPVLRLGAAQLQSLPAPTASTRRPPQP